MTDRAFAGLSNEDWRPKVPGSPGDWRETERWFSTQLILSLTIGVSAFIVFCFLRTRWGMIYMPRTKLKDFSPAPAHWQDIQKASASSRFFGWIIPTLRTSEFVVLQTVGLDAAVLLNFYRMAFLLFSLFATVAAVVLMPIYKLRGGSTDSPEVPPPDDGKKHFTWWADKPHGKAPKTWYDMLIDPNTSAGLQLLFAYLFTFLTLSFLHRNYHRFILARQTFGLQLIHSVAARTVITTNLPKRLRGDRALAEYFEACGWNVESVSVCRHVSKLKNAIDRRTSALLQLEKAWVLWVGNPAEADGYDPDIYRNAKKAASPHVENHLSFTSGAPSNEPQAPHDDPESLRQRYSIIHTAKHRPTKRVSFGQKVDAIEYWEDKYFEADQEVRELRKTGMFDPSEVAFITFEDVKSTQAASQVCHFPEHSRVVTNLAPEPRDVIWNKISITAREARVRDFVVMGFMVVLLTGWITPVAALATLLSYKEIKRVLPWLAKIIDKSPRLEAIVQNTLPSLALILFNSILPFLLEWLCYQQGFKSRSGAEYSLTRKHYLFLVISVLFIFHVTSTYWALARELADEPMKIPEKIAVGLQNMNLRHFMVSYVMLQGIGLMPLQLLSIGPLFSLAWGRLWAKTPRDFAEANAPPQLNYGWVYPQALLVFTITIVYSVVSPLILLFGAIYFGAAYLVFKYKLLFIYFKPYESNGEAWKITFDRLVFALVLFQTFVTGLFSLRKSFWLLALMIPLIFYTIWWGITMSRDFTPLSKFLALSNICDVQRGEPPVDVLDINDPTVPRSQSGLNHKRYAVNDETLYVAPADKHTDYSQPPMNTFYYGVLDTGKRRYGHPALTGALPTPWLPAKERPAAFGDAAASRRGIVLSLRRKINRRLRRKQTNEDDGDQSRNSNTDISGLPRSSGSHTPSDPGLGASGPGMSSSTYSNSTLNANPWARDPTPSPSGGARNLPNFDTSSEVIAHPEENLWEDDGEDEDATPLDSDEVPASPSTYFHRPNRRRTISSSGSGGA